MLFALVALGVLVTTSIRLVRTKRATRQSVRAWMTSAVTTRLDGIDVPVHGVGAAFPIVAIVGLFRPRLVIARSVLKRCHRDEMKAILAHESWHLHRHDNIRRAVFSAVPDVLGWLPLSRRSVSRQIAAEESADDAAASRTGGRAAGRGAHGARADAEHRPECSLPATALYRGKYRAARRACSILWTGADLAVVIFGLSPVSCEPSESRAHSGSGRDRGQLPALVSGARSPTVTVSLGSDILFDRKLLHERTVGIVCNPASVDARLRHVTERAEAAGVRIGAIFGPQHGFRSDVQDNMIETPHANDRHRKVPIYSLYSDTREPAPEMLRGLDAMLIELQDVGTRIYTYVYTMANCLKAAARQGLPVVVCDRPNPIGGLVVEGPLLDERFTSFVGQYPLPMRHGMTIGELAVLFNEHFGIGAKLEVMKMTGWSRPSYFDETGLSWVLPSPNLPTLDSATVIPCVLFEGTNVSEGRGTTRPFELIGAPWIDPESFTAELNSRGLPGVYFRPTAFEPTFHKHARQTCGGCQVHVTDRKVFRAVETGVTLIETFRNAGPDRFKWRDPLRESLRGILSAEQQATFDATPPYRRNR